ncbi:MAG: SUMF1/EgtB/PvdO family nonheme iron enzyme, partial [Rikenellaceae bacterium]
VDPQPMSPSSYLYKHYTFLPKENNVDDGNLIQVAGKQYDANLFRLYDMHGNVAEWTRSSYVPYPYKENSKVESEYKVARGGSFIERPKVSTSHTRKGYYPHQRVYNVGFRVIIED